jgi:hypothetical protein
VTTRCARCAFCDAKLRGKKIAFDPGRGRLWEICARCGQWNISALEADERTRTVAELELEFRAASERGGTSAIGVARVGGRTLVRVGDASWREFAAWRYGRRLRARYVVGHVTMWLAVPIALLLFDPKPVAYLIALPLPLGQLVYFAWQLWDRWRLKYRVVWKARTPGGEVGTVRVGDAGEGELLRDEQGWRLVLAHSRGASALRGQEAVRGLAAVMPAVNLYGGTDDEIDAAIDVVERLGGSSAVFENLAKTAPLGDEKSQIKWLKTEEKLALEMCAHEEQERRAFMSEVSVLGLELKHAAEVTRIVESMAEK